MREIHVDVGQLVERHAVLVEETAEVEIEADGADAADAQAIAGERIGGAAARDPFDAAPAAFLQEVPHDQEIFLVADLGDDGQFLLELRSEAGVVFRVAALKPSMTSRRRKAAGVEPSGGVKPGNCGLPREKANEQRSAISRLWASSSGRAAKSCRISAGGPEMIFAVQPLVRVRLAQQGERADALHHVVLPAVGGEFVMDGQRGDAGQGRPGACRRRRGWRPAR